ncbi:MAG TPA: flagellar basal body rod protein FlgB [Lachnospiraceae bacterium]|nr:flagellar basal body rod protein FlgB [Lachnospiraceae bacterium]
MADYLWEKQKITMNNIANSSTPGYKAQYVTFEDELREKLHSGKTSEIREDIAHSRVRVETKQDESTRMDGNNVNVDVEEVELASTTIQYQYALRSITDDLARLRSVIK